MLARTNPVPEIMSVPLPAAAAPPPPPPTNRSPALVAKVPPLMSKVPVPPPVVALAPSVGAAPGTDDTLALFDRNVEALAAALDLPHPSAAR